MSADVPPVPAASRGEATGGSRREAAGINLQRLYEYRFREVDKAARQLAWRQVARYVHARMGGPARVLDPAAGLGEFIAAVPAAERWGLGLISHGDAALAGARMSTADIMDADLPDAYFDGVFVSDLLAQLPDQNAVADVLARLSRAMQAGGRIAIMGPNFRYCAREYFDRADQMVILSHVAVAEHLYAAGFDVAAVEAKFLPCSFRGLLRPSARLTRLYLSTPPMWRLLGKQFLVIGRKPARPASRRP